MCSAPGLDGGWRGLGSAGQLGTCAAVPVPGAGPGVGSGADAAGALALRMKEPSVSRSNRPFLCSL